MSTRTPNLSARCVAGNLEAGLVISPVTDALIGALALRAGGIITRNGKHFRSFYPRLRVIDPTGW